MELVLADDLLGVEVDDARVTCDAADHDLVALVQELERGNFVRLEVEQLYDRPVVCVPELDAVRESHPEYVLWRPVEQREIEVVLQAGCVEHLVGREVAFAAAVFGA